MAFWDAISERLGLKAPAEARAVPYTRPVAAPPVADKPIDALREGLLGQGAPRGSTTGKPATSPRPKSKGSR